MTCPVGRTHDPTSVVCISCEMQGGMICQPALLKMQAAKAKKGKYRNEPVQVDGILFDSKKEGARYQQLKAMERAGKISNLERQRSFVLAPAVNLHGRKKPALRYVADFCYQENGNTVVEDVKSKITRINRAYRIKLHLMKHVHDIEVRES